MELSLGFLIESLGLFLAAKLLNVNLTIITAPIVVFLAFLASNFVPGVPGMVLGLVIYVGAIKTFDRSTDFIKIVGLFVVGLAVQQIFYAQILRPMLFG